MGWKGLARRGRLLCEIFNKRSFKGYSGDFSLFPSVFLWFSSFLEAGCVFFFS